MDHDIAGHHVVLEALGAVPTQCRGVDVVAGVEGNVSMHRLAQELVGDAHDGGLTNAKRVMERFLDLAGAIFSPPDLMMSSLRPTK